MLIKCPKCSYERNETDAAPDWQCPSCGVAYAKVSDSSNSSSEKFQDNNAPNVEKSVTSTQRSTSQPLKLLMVGFTCLVIGYFTGREHLKMELRESITTAAEEMQRSLATAFGGNNKAAVEKKSGGSGPEKKDKLEAKSQEAPFSVALVSKGFMNADYQAGIPSDAITFEVEFKNLTGKDIRAFEGYLEFTDLLDNTILGASLTINDPVSAGNTKLWSGKLDFNQFIDRHQSLKTADYENLRISFEHKKILFADGSIEEF